MPGALLPDDPATPAPADWYSAEELAVFRLSSKSHWDVPVLVGGKVIHALVSHPTPPVFDGPEDRNGTRNHDEIRLWSDYVLPSRSGYIYDDDGERGGLQRGARFVIMGDQNADPFDGDSVAGAAQQLLDNPRVNTSLTPTSPGGPEQAVDQGEANLTHRGDPAFDTADFVDVPGPGNLRVDYVLPQQQPEAPRRRGVLAAVHRPAVPAGRRLPLPDLRPPPGLGRRARARPPVDADDPGQGRRRNQVMEAAAPRRRRMAAPPMK